MSSTSRAASPAADPHPYLLLALRVVAIVFATETAVSGHYGLAPSVLYYALLAGDPPVILGVAAAAYFTKGKARVALLVALAAFLVVGTIAFADFSASRFHLHSLKPITGRTAWTVAAYANIVGFYGVVVGGMLNARKKLHQDLGLITMALLGAIAIGFINVRWVRPTPPLIPLFNALLFVVPASYLFVVTERPQLKTAGDTAGTPPPTATPSEAQPQR